MFIADLHIHSKYSRATSRDCDTAHLDFWARRKGIHLLGTGDFTHPAWRAELAEKLIPAEEGLYRLREEYRLPDSIGGQSLSPRFILSGEISSIYKKNGRTRKVHNVILLPSLEDAEALAHRLESIGNIHSDGRPILGLDSRDLLEITLEACPQAVFIPAHIWTPHFSMFGAFSGFDTVEECFGDLSEYIHAVETGLSSDPPMNWRVAALDRFTLVSNSDAHSPAKIGREANLLDTDLSYPALAKAIQTGEGFVGTVEFFPEEGKYHLDGHRACGCRLTPSQTAAYGGRCPVCGKKITIGVQHRVEELADRPEGFRPPDAKPFESLSPLPEVIAASTGLSVTSKKIQQRYESLLAELGPEFDILRQVPLEEIRQVAGPCVAEGIRRLRNGQVHRIPGYDGEYGKILLLSPSEIQALEGQTSLFGISGPAEPSAPSLPKIQKPASSKTVSETQEQPTQPEQLNPEQQAAVCASEPAVAVIAGPGTGKTKTLVARIAYLVEQCGVKPSQITAVTFTNQAAAEMRGRLEQRLGGKRAVRGMTIGTFHAICLELLGEVSLIGEPDALALASQIIQNRELSLSPRRFLQEVSRIKNGCTPDQSLLEEDAFLDYQTLLQKKGRLDFDDLLVSALTSAPSGGRRFSHLLVDEFQDINDLQYRLVRQWNQGGQSLFVIGDPDQAIYGFRGAGADCFDRLKEDLPGLQEIRLVQNYRSTPQILSAALSAISPNPGPVRTLLPNRPDGDPVRLINAPSDLSEGIAVARQIAFMTGGLGMLEAHNAEQRRVVRSFSDIAVLCRTHRQEKLLEKCLRHDSIPCVVTGREDYLADDEVRGTIGFFGWLLHGQDMLALENALRLIWRCPADVVEQAVKAVFREKDGDIIGALRAEAAAYPHLLPFLGAAEAFMPMVRKEKPRRLLECWLDKKHVSPAMEKLQNAAVFFGDMDSFYQTLLLGREADLHRAAGKMYASGAVRLMTLHAAKGLEFPVVILCGVKEGNIPLESAKGETDLEEERRLFFVGLTRAQEELVLTTSGKPSVFLSNLPATQINREAVAAQQVQNEQLSLF